jgi:hypothetical protein
LLAGIAVGTPAHMGRFEEDSPFWPWLRVTREVTAGTGACVTIRRSAWDELDEFDCRFPSNYNDVEPIALKNNDIKNGSHSKNHTAGEHRRYRLTRPNGRLDPKIQLDNVMYFADT